MGKENGNGPEAAKDPKAARQARAAEALRANLRRRKAQARERQAALNADPKQPSREE